MLLTQTCSPRRKARSWRCSSAPAVCLWVWHWTAASVVWWVKSQGFPPGLWWSRCSPVPTVGRLHLKSERQTQGNIKAVFFKLFGQSPTTLPLNKWRFWGSTGPCCSKIKSWQITFRKDWTNHLLSLCKVISDSEIISIYFLDLHKDVRHSNIKSYNLWVFSRHGKTLKTPAPTKNWILLMLKVLELRMWSANRPGVATTMWGCLESSSAWATISVKNSKHLCQCNFKPGWCQWRS